MSTKAKTYGTNEIVVRGEYSAVRRERALRPGLSWNVGIGPGVALLKYEESGGPVDRLTYRGMRLLLWWTMLVVEVNRRGHVVKIMKHSIQRIRTDGVPHPIIQTE